MKGVVVMLSGNESIENAIYEYSERK